jgi:hypothetical protein
LATSEASPLKSAATKSLATPIAREEKIQSQSKEDILSQNDNPFKNKNGCQDEETFKKTERNNIKLPLMGMRRGVSMELPTPCTMAAKEAVPNTCKNTSSKFRTSLIADYMGDINAGGKINNDDNDLGY